MFEKKREEETDREMREKRIKKILKFYNICSYTSIFPYLREISVEVMRWHRHRRRRRRGREVMVREEKMRG